jgi:hypothetical protein
MLRLADVIQRTVDYQIYEVDGSENSIESVELHIYFPRTMVDETSDGVQKVLDQFCSVPQL